MILLIDNYDSFSYNLFQFVGTINPDIKVIRNDEMTVSEIEKLAPSHILISPGPGKPSDAGICEDVIKYFKGKIPILGVAGSNPVRRATSEQSSLCSGFFMPEFHHSALSATFHLLSKLPPSGRASPVSIACAEVILDL